MVVEAILSLCKVISDMISSSENKPNLKKKTKTTKPYLCSQNFHLPKVVDIMSGFEQTSEMSHLL